MRKVSDILDLGGPVAFVEIVHGRYQGVCPWCAKDIQVVEATTFGELYAKLLEPQIEHMSVCEKGDATEMEVEVR